MGSDWRHTRLKRPQECRTGLVLSVAGRRATVLVPGGAVVRMQLDAPGARPGDEVRLPGWVLADAPPPATRRARVAAAAACALALALIISGLTMYLNPLPAVAMVSLDINPGVTLWVNSVMRVVSVQAADDEGQRLVQELAPAHRPLREVVYQLVDMAAKELPAGTSECWLVIAAAPVQPDEVLSPYFLSTLDKLKDRALTRLGAGLPSPTEVHGAVLSVPSAVADDARELGVSPGKYALVLTAQETGADVRIDDVRVGDIMSAVKGAGVKPPDLLEQAKKVSLEEAWKKFREKVKTERPAAGDPAGGSDPGGPQGPPGPPSTAGGSGPGQGGSGPGQGTGSVGQGGSVQPPEPKPKDYPIIKVGGPAQGRSRWEEVIDRFRQILGDKATLRPPKRGGR